MYRQKNRGSLASPQIQRTKNGMVFRCKCRWPFHSPGSQNPSICATVSGGVTSLFSVVWIYSFKLCLLPESQNLIRTYKRVRFYVIYLKLGEYYFLEKIVRLYPHHCRDAKRASFPTGVLTFLGQRLPYWYIRIFAAIFFFPLT